jgi:23S rRNA (uracil1939-C5)-methyltransferase
VEPDKIVYVSCDPATLARDLKLFCASGVYQLVKVCPVDQFPMTTHVEVVSLLQRLSNTRPKAITLDVEMEDYYRIKGARTND